ncbi:MAG: Outer membrane protein assembly factor BamA precursor [Acidobacteria bacterium ADurb.Bin340]|nr:MAG: Outer membrane protein assembly factor BamA precursor [Acidobacteria bacterium ADurb.Bin340]
MTPSPVRLPERFWRPTLRGGLLPLLLVAGLHAQDPEQLSEIAVIGAQKQTPETVIFKAGLKVGDDLRALDLTAVVERLWASGAFEDIKLEVLEGKGGKKLVIRVVERPIIKEVDYRGGTEVGLSSLKDKIKEKKLEIGENAVYSPEDARKVKEVIVEQCAEKGFRNPVVDVSLEPIGPGLSRLVFDIKEGAKLRIYTVKFKGNTVISSAKLRRVMEKTRQHWMFSWLTSHDLLVDKNLEEDLQSVKKAYWRKGYKDVFVGQPAIQVDDHTSERQKQKNIKRQKEGKSPKNDLRATLTIPILEGDLFYEGHLTVVGNEKVFKGKRGEEFYRLKIAEAKRDNRSWLAKFLDLKPSTKDLPSSENRPFDLDALEKGIDKIREAHSNMSYIMFRSEKKLEVREENGVKKVDVALKVDEGEPYTIRRINFEGNTTTKDKVLRRALMVKEGDPFSLEAFKDSFTGLGQLGFFDVKTQEPKIDPLPDKPQVDITIRGEEAGVNELLFQGGYGSLFGFSLGVSFSTKNLGGGGETLGFSYNGSKFNKSISVHFTEPYVFDMPYSFSASVGAGSTDYDASRVGEAYAYQQHSKSLGVSVGTRLSTFFPGRRWAFFTTYGVGYNFSSIRLDGGRNYYFRDTSTQLTSSINQSLTYSTVNHPFKPTAGTKLGFNLEYGGWQMGSDKPYLRATWEFTKIGNIAERHIFAANMAYGYLRNLGNQALPVYQLYRPGGENSIRGYRYGQVGSVVFDPYGNPVVIGGNKQLIVNLEYQFKIADQFRVVAFYDAGNAWAPGTKIFSRDPVSYTRYDGVDVNYVNPALVRSAGLELRFFLPISPAPLRLIWSRKLNPYPFDPDGKSDFQFSIGTTF